MKKACAIWLALLLLVTASPTNRLLHAVAELGITLHHLAAHQGASSLEELFSAHFIWHEHQGDDDHAHDPLPFDCCHQHTHLPTGLLLSYTLAAHLRLPVRPAPEGDGRRLMGHAARWRSALHAGKVWQPPRA
jgi:hypothetical protein